MEGDATPFRVKISGAGSIGNHLAHAARRLGWDVTVCDVSTTALERMKGSVYPGRYGAWDPSIKLATVDHAPRGGFDLICIGTPPDVHVRLALEALDEAPRAILVEKPLCTPALERADELRLRAAKSSTQVFVGYDHAVGGAARTAEAMIRTAIVGEVRTIDVEFREHWEGIFRAHPWLTGPEDSYLGYWTRGGGASGEHSHALNLWQHFAHVVGAGRVAQVAAMMNYVEQGRAVYDDVCLMSLRTETGLIGRVVQDVVTSPPLKRARLHGTEGVVEWVNGYSPEGDAVICRRTGRDDEVHVIPKKRPDDFIEELKHIRSHLAVGSEPSAIGLDRGLDSMLVVAAAHRSHAERRWVEIDYGRGYRVEAIRPVDGHTAMSKGRAVHLDEERRA